MTQIAADILVPVPAHLLEDFVLYSIPQAYAMKSVLNGLRVKHRGEDIVPVPLDTLKSAVYHFLTVDFSYTREMKTLMAKHTPQQDEPKPDEPYLKRLYDGTVSDSRDGRTIGFTSSEFSNAWAVHRGEAFDTHDLSPFHEEFRSWLAKHDAELIEKVREELMAKLAGDFSSKMDAAASAGVGPIVTVYSDHPFGPVDEHLTKVREIGGIESL